MKKDSIYVDGTLPQPASSVDKHIAVVHTLIQAAINLEEFTIPLYMCSMYSLVGTHQITGSNEFYRGRWWPGCGKTIDPNSFIYDKAQEYWEINQQTKEKTKATKTYNRADKIPKDASLFRPTNNKIFNMIFKVFIEEMLHLQLAANLGKVLGFTEPDFTHGNLMNKESFAWTCYGKPLSKVKKEDANTIIPYIVDLKDMSPFTSTVNGEQKKQDFSKIKVCLGPLDENQIQLFQAIELEQDDAKKALANAPKGKYFPKVPFKNMPDLPDGATSYDPTVLPMFGSIGHLYECLWAYLNMTIKSEKSSEERILLSYIVERNDKPYPQRDIFNNLSAGHPRAEYPGFETTIPDHRLEFIKIKIKNLINAITEQGEGGPVAQETVSAPGVVPTKSQADRKGIQRNRKTYDDEGSLLVNSASAEARAGANIVAMDHEEIFDAIEKMMKASDFMTWETWHKEGNKWTAEMLEANDYVNNEYNPVATGVTPANNASLPTAQAVADAMNLLKKQDDASKSKEAANYLRLCKASTGSIWGITHVLNNYWSAKTADAGQNPAFPFPSMGGSGDRMSICWALFGKVPDIGIGMEPKERRDSNAINHACQGLFIDPKNPNGKSNESANNCAEVAMYHTCKGSNACMGEGGCGYVQQVGGGSSCGGSTLTAMPQNSCSSSIVFSGPGNNACGGQGGCAVPISASQLFPKPAIGAIPPEPRAQMALHDFYYVEVMGGGPAAKPIRVGEGGSIDDKCKETQITYIEGDSVYGHAWKAYEAVCKNRNVKKPTMPEPSTFRLAFPPST